MTGFFATALGFPAVVFSFALCVVLLYWLLVALGGADIDLLDADVDVDLGAGGGHDLGTGGGHDLDAGGHDGSSGLVAWFGLGGVPVTVALSLLITAAWALCMVGSAVLDAVGIGDGVLGAVLGVVLLVLAVLGGLLVTRLIVLPLRRMFPESEAPSRTDFVGRTCVIRTGSVTDSFGQAELTSADGSSAVIQVRLAPEHAAERPLSSGSTAIVYDYDGVKEIFWVAASDPAISTEPPRGGI